VACSLRVVVNEFWSGRPSEMANALLKINQVFKTSKFNLLLILEHYTNFQQTIGQQAAGPVKPTLRSSLRG
jgi:hypothetical protein